MSHLLAALQSLREAQAELTKQAYQPMLDPAAQGMPPGGAPPMDPAMAAQGGMPPGGAPPMDPAMAAQVAPPAAPAAPAPAPGADPQAMMEIVSALESIGQALSSLTNRMAEIEKEQKSMMKDFLRAQGEQKVLVQFLKQQAPMGSEVAGAEPPMPAAGEQSPMGGVDPAMLEQALMQQAMVPQGAPAGV